jgi:hypothetical protein
MDGARQAQDVRTSCGDAMASPVLWLITNRRAKYFIIVFWVVMVVVAAPLAGS